MDTVNCFENAISRIKKTREMIFDYINFESCKQGKVISCSNECEVNFTAVFQKRELDQEIKHAIVTINKEVSLN